MKIVVKCDYLEPELNNKNNAGIGTVIGAWKKKPMLPRYLHCFSNSVLINHDMIFRLENKSGYLIIWQKISKPI